MFNYPEQAKNEATHTDDVGYLYRAVTDSSKIVYVEYWDLRLNRWCQDLGRLFAYLVKIEK